MCDQHAITHEPQFIHCKIEALDSLKDLLKTQGINLTTERVLRGQLGHEKSLFSKICAAVV